MLTQQPINEPEVIEQLRARVTVLYETLRTIKNLIGFIPFVGNILEQECHINEVLAETEVIAEALLEDRDQAKEALAKEIARRVRLEKELTLFKTSVQKYADQCTQCLYKGDEIPGADSYTGKTGE